ncbi:hypothetical protein [Dyadobacter sp. LHD-138]|uniref:hypothetical protein n=1 Tax=Dyadobacter sp. LHD-138 TaxID=3071413 RepID=UPI0027E07635|nr:hypothetical protein [Dyadobacter sp. LHD-138]MDQ6482236.1 hypothetical protein [Dyadobacter sp. LHD-138]
MKKYIIAGACVLIMIITTFFIVRHIKNNNKEQTPLEKWEQAVDSAAAYRNKVITDSINLIEAKKKLKGYEDKRDTLSKAMADDSFAMAVRRSVLRARIQADIQAGTIRDSLGRHGAGTGSH